MRFMTPGYGKLSVLLALFSMMAGCTAPARPLPQRDSPILEVTGTALALASEAALDLRRDGVWVSHGMIGARLDVMRMDGDKTTELFHLDGIPLDAQALLASRADDNAVVVVDLQEGQGLYRWNGKQTEDLTARLQKALEAAGQGEESFVFAIDLTPEGDIVLAVTSYQDDFSEPPSRFCRLAESGDLCEPVAGSFKGSLVAEAGATYLHVDGSLLRRGDGGEWSAVTDGYVGQLAALEGGRVAYVEASDQETADGVLHVIGKDGKEERTVQITRWDAQYYSQWFAGHSMDGLWSFGIDVERVKADSCWLCDVFVWPELVWSQIVVYRLTDTLEEVGHIDQMFDDASPRPDNAYFIPVPLSDGSLRVKVGDDRSDTTAVFEVE